MTTGVRPFLTAVVASCIPAAGIGQSTRQPAWTGSTVMLLVCLNGANALSGPMARDVLHAKTGVFACVEERHALEVWQPAATEGGAFAKRAGPAGRVNGSCPNAATARAIGPNRVDWGDTRSVLSNCIRTRRRRNRGHANACRPWAIEAGLVQSLLKIRKRVLDPFDRGQQCRTRQGQIEPHVT